MWVKKEKLKIKSDDDGLWKAIASTYRKVLIEETSIKTSFNQLKEKLKIKLTMMMLMHPTFGTGQVELLEREINRNGAFNLVLLFGGLSSFQ